MVPPSVMPPATTRPPFNGLPSSAEQKTDENANAKLLAAFGSVERTKLQYKLMLARIALADEFPRPCVQVLFSDTRAFPERTWWRPVQNSDAATATFGHLDPEQSRAFVLATGS